MEVEEGCGGCKAVVCNNRDRGRGGGFQWKDRCGAKVAGRLGGIGIQASEGGLTSRER